MARYPYRIARQEHLGDALDELQVGGRLTWRWEYDSARSRALYHVTLAGSEETTLETRAAEQLVLNEFGAIGIAWFAVPHPGGEKQLQETRRRLDSP